MRFNIERELTEIIQSPIVGNVYTVRGGSGAKLGHVMVIVSIINGVATTLTINKAGDIVSGSNYGIHYFEEKCPIAHCAGLDVLNFEIKRI